MYNSSTAWPSYVNTGSIRKMGALKCNSFFVYYYKTNVKTGGKSLSPSYILFPHLTCEKIETNVINHLTECQELIHHWFSISSLFSHCLK